MLKRVVTAIAVGALVGMTTSMAWSQQDIRWGTPPVGTAGHKAMVTLANLLNKRIRELPPGVAYMPKPWQPLNVLIAADQALASRV